MDLNTITIAMFKEFFRRDFPYAQVATTDPNYVLDSDIQRAFDEAQAVINQGIFPGDPETKIGYLYLSAHYLYTNLFAGVASGAAVNTVTSKTVGNVTESYQVPEVFINDPIFSFFNRTSYGQRYLNYIAPYIIGNIGINYGTSQP